MCIGSGSNSSNSFGNREYCDGNTNIDSVDFKSMDRAWTKGNCRDNWFDYPLYNKCEWLRNGVNAIFGGIADFVKGVINKIKGFFNFEWKLPKIKLPHFKASGEWSLAPPKVPKFSVDWYANGGILNSPTIFGMNGDRAMGGGEAGAEAVLPIELLKTYIRDEMQSNNAALAQMIAEALSELTFVIENNIALGDKKLAEILADAVIKKISSSVKWKKGAVGA